MSQSLPSSHPPPHPPNPLFLSLHISLSRQKRLHILLSSETEKLRKQQSLSSELLRKVSHAESDDVSRANPGIASPRHKRTVTNLASPSHTSQTLQQPPFRSSNSNDLFDNVGKSNHSFTNPLIQQRLSALRHSESYVQLLSSRHKHMTLLVARIKQFVMQYQTLGQLQRESTIQEIFTEICGKGGKGVIYCEGCFRDFIVGRDLNGTENGTNATGQQQTGGIHQNLGSPQQQIRPQSAHHQETSDSNGPTTTLSHKCSKCRLVSFCHHPQCTEKHMYHHPQKICEIMQEVQSMDLMEWGQMERYGEETADEALQKPTNSDTIDRIHSTDGMTPTPAPDTLSVTTQLPNPFNNDVVAQAQQHLAESEAQYAQTLASLNAHREYVDNHILKRHHESAHSAETIHLMNELRQWSDKTRIELSQFLLSEKERQDKEELNQNVLDDDLRRINSFLTASMYQREHFLSETENKTMKSVLNSPLQDFYSSNFKESNPDFILQYKLIQMVLQLREKLTANDKHTQELKKKVTSLEKKLDADKKAFQRQIADRDFSIDELTQKNRALQMNYENIQEKFHQALVFSKKRSKKVAPSLSVATQTDLGQTYSLLTNASRQMEALKDQLQALRDHQLRQDDKFVEYMDTLEEEIGKKTAEVDSRMVRTNLALQQARAKLRGAKISDESPTVEVQTDPITDLKSISVEHIAIQMPELHLPLLKTRTRAQSITSMTVPNVTPIPASEQQQVVATPVSAVSTPNNLDASVAQEIFDIQNRMKSLEEKKRKRSGSTVDLNTSSATLSGRSSVSESTKTLSNLKYSKYLTFATRDHHMLVQRMAQDNWCLFAKLAKLQLIANQLTLDCEFINYDVDLRAKLMLRLYERARLYLQCWSTRHQLYIRLRLRLEKAFKTYMIKTTTEFQNQTDPEKAGAATAKVSKPSGKKASYDDLVSQLSLFLPDMYERQWYTLTAGYKKNVQALVSRGTQKLDLLTKHEKLRIDALAPLWRYNFQDLTLDTRRIVLAEFCEYVKMGEKETEEEKRRLLSRISAYIESDAMPVMYEDEDQDGEQVESAELPQVEASPVQMSAEKPGLPALKKLTISSMSNPEKLTTGDARTFVQKAMSHNSAHTFTLADVPQDNTDAERLIKKKKLEMQFEHDFKEILGGNREGKQYLGDSATGPSGDASPRGSLGFSKMKRERRESIPLLDEEAISGAPKSMRSNIMPKDPVM